jgi:phosphatidylglycerophosphatase A
MKKLLITFFGLGYLPLVPGTWGSLGGLIVFYPLAWYLGYTGGLLGVLFALCVLAGIIGISLGHWANEAFGKKDPGQFVLDEVVGMWFSLMLIPFAGLMGLKGLLFVGLVQFVLFRIFDILKPTPARQLENLPGGWGIMMDDVMAGIYANLFGQLIFRFLLV